MIKKLIQESLFNNNIKGFKAYYKTGDSTIVTPEYSMEILKMYMEEYEKQYPESKLIGIENQETGELIEE